MYKDSKWARELIDLQNEEGFWGYFHTLSEPGKYPVTTEQALRRLQILGYTMDDAPIQKAVGYMNDCLLGKKQTPDRREKLHNWDIFTCLMLSTWIRRFTKENSAANSVAATWAGIISAAFSSGKYDQGNYAAAYTNAFGEKPNGGRLVDFTSFYQVSLVSDQFDAETEGMVFDYILNHQNGIYYIYGEAPVSVLPHDFVGKQASRYLGAIELLTQYRNSLNRLQFVSDWLNRSKNENGRWDMGGPARDMVYFPLSDSWRHRETREADCTYRVEKLLSAIKP